MFIARRGRPRKVFSDNGKTFAVAATWVRKLMKDEQVHDWLAKQALYKTLGKVCLYWKELQEVIIDIQITLNNRPLSYIEEDVQMPIFTPNSLMFGQPGVVPEEEIADIDEVVLRKRAKYVKRCKNAL